MVASVLLKLVESNRVRTLLAGVLLVLGCATPGHLPQGGEAEREGERLMGAGKFDEARLLFMDAIRDGDTLLGWIGVSRTSMELRDYTTAEAALSHAMQHDSGTAPSAEALGLTALQLANRRPVDGRPFALVAASLFDAAGRRDPDRKGVVYLSGMAHLAAGDADAAVSLLERAYDEGHGEVVVLRALVSAWRASGARDRARAGFERLAATHRLPEGFAADVAWAQTTDRATSAPTAPATRVTR